MRYRTLLGMGTLLRSATQSIYFGSRHDIAELTAAYRGELLVRIFSLRWHLQSFISHADEFAQSFYYGATIFTSVGIADSFVTQIILGAVNFICTFLGLYLMEKVALFSHMISLLNMFSFSMDGENPSSSVVYGNLYGCSSSQLPVPPKTLKRTRQLETVSKWHIMGNNIPHLIFTHSLVMIVSACLFILGFASSWAPYVYPHRLYFLSGPLI